MESVAFKWIGDCRRTPMAKSPLTRCGCGRARSTLWAAERPARAALMCAVRFRAAHLISQWERAARLYARIFLMRTAARRRSLAVNGRQIFSIATPSASLCPARATLSDQSASPTAASTIQMRFCARLREHQPPARHGLMKIAAPARDATGSQETLEAVSASPKESRSPAPCSAPPIAPLIDALWASSPVIFCEAQHLRQRVH